MILPKPEDALHKAWMYRVLTEIADNRILSSMLKFKGGTCAAMRGFIERFSIDLDFDLEDAKDVKQTQIELEKTFQKLGLDIKEKSQHAPQYFVKYPTSGKQKRNTLKIEVTYPAPRENRYENVRLVEIDRILVCHTVPTMVANKLVALVDRFKQHHGIAGRDLFDIHTFLIQGYRYRSEIIKERTGKSAAQFLKELKEFIQTRVTQTVIDQDLNTLLPPGSFRRMRPYLKSEVLWLLTNEVQSIN